MEEEKEKVSMVGNGLSEQTAVQEKGKVTPDPVFLLFFRTRPQGNLCYTENAQHIIAIIATNRKELNSVIKTQPPIPRYCV